VLTNQAPGDVMGLYPADPSSWVQGPVDGAGRYRPIRQVLAPAGTHAGAKIPIWVNNTGTTVDPPPRRQDVVTGSITVGVTGGLIFRGVLLYGPRTLVPISPLVAAVG
jgi:hypothetical protein